MDFRIDARFLSRYGSLVVGLLLIGSALAQPRTVAAVAPFTGTLQKIYETGVIRIGHRENSPPFAFLDACTTTASAGASTSCR